MQKSIFSKYFTVCATLIIASITVLGAVFLIFASQYFKTDRLNLMRRNAEHAAEFAQKQWSVSGALDTDVLQLYLGSMADTIDADFFITDENGVTIYCTELAPCAHTDKSVSSDIMRTLRQSGSYAEMGKLGGMYGERYYTVAIPVGAEGETAYVFVSAHASSQQQSFLNEMIKIFLISAATVLIITSIAVYFITIQLVKPLRQMADAAKRFGRGEFDTRLEVTSYRKLP